MAHCHTSAAFQRFTAYISQEIRKRLCVPVCIGTMSRSHKEGSYAAIKKGWVSGCPPQARDSIERKSQCRDTIWKAPQIPWFQGLFKSSVNSSMSWYKRKRKLEPANRTSVAFVSRTQGFLDCLLWPLLRSSSPGRSLALVPASVFICGTFSPVADDYSLSIHHHWLPHLLLLKMRPSSSSSITCDVPTGTFYPQLVHSGSLPAATNTIWQKNLLCIEFHFGTIHPPSSKLKNIYIDFTVNKIKLITYNLIELTSV